MLGRGELFMDLFELDLFVDAISKYLKLNQPFTILQEKKGLTWEPAYSVAANRDLESIQIFSDYLFANVSVLDFRALPEEYFYKIRALVNLLDKFIKDRKKKHSGFGGEVFQEAENKILALKLGGRIHYKEIGNIDRDLYRFIIVNELDRKFFALGIQLNSNLALPFEIEANKYQELLWDELARLNLKDSSGRVYGYRFFYKEKLVMETNTDFLLTEDFSILYPGVTFYHPRKALHLAPLDKRSSLEWDQKNLIEVVTLNRRGALFLLLRSENGNIYCVGSNQGKLSTPVDSYFGAYKCRYQIGITKEEFHQIFEIFEKEKYYKKNINEKGLLSVLQETLKLEPLPEKMLVTKYKFLAYLMLPYGIIKFFCNRRKYPCHGWRDLFMRPYVVSSMNKNRVKQWLEEAAASRSGGDKCFE